MKVLHISDKYEGGGAEAVFRDTLKVTEELGFKNYTLCSDGKVSVFSYVFSIKYFIKTIKKVIDIKPNIIHIHNYYHYLTPSILLALRFLKKKYCFKIIFTAHDYHIICPNSGLQYFKNNKRRNFNPDINNINMTYVFDHRSIIHSELKKAQYKLNYSILKLNNVFDVIISPSEFLKNVLETYGIQQRIEVIRNPVNEVVVETQKDNRSFDIINIVYMGRLSPEKGLEEFIKKLNDEKIYNINFHLYGDGELKNKLINLENNENIKISLHGFMPRSKLIQEISKYDIFVLPSVWFENAPISIIEAAAAGLPILVPNYGGLKELAACTLYHHEFSYEEPSLNEAILTAMKYKGINKVKDIGEFSYDRYKNRINTLYEDMNIHDLNKVTK